MGSKAGSFIDFFKDIPDHRLYSCKLHRVEEILLLTFCGIIADCSFWPYNARTPWHGGGRRFGIARVYQFFI